MNEPTAPSSRTHRTSSRQARCTSWTGSMATHFSCAGLYEQNSWIQLVYAWLMASEICGSMLSQAGRAALGATVGADRDADPVLELRIQIAVEEIRRLHDVHVAVHEPEPVLHGTLLFISSPRTAGPQPRDVLRLALPLTASTVSV